LTAHADAAQDGHLDGLKGYVVSEFSTAQAKAQFAQLVQQAEAGQPVRTTRRGRSVAVVLPDTEYVRLGTTPQQRESLFVFSTRMRQLAADAGLSLVDEKEWCSLRDQSKRASPTELS
jgi:prevent-host-death family protein